MTQDMIEMAKKAGIPTGSRFVGGEVVECLTLEVQAFAKLVAEAAASKEREACAKLVEDSWMAFSRNSSRLDITPFPELDYVAKVIRARGKA